MLVSARREVTYVVPLVEQRQGHSHDVGSDARGGVTKLLGQGKVFASQLCSRNVAAAEERGVAPQTLRAHHGIAPRLVKTLLDVLEDSDVSVGNDGNAEVLLDFAYEAPVSGGAFFSFVLAGATVDAKYCGPCVLNHLSVL